MIFLYEPLYGRNGESLIKGIDTIISVFRFAYKLCRNGESLIKGIDTGEINKLYANLMNNVEMEKAR